VLQRPAPCLLRHPCRGQVGALWWGGEGVLGCGGMHRRHEGRHAETQRDEREELLHVLVPTLSRCRPLGPSVSPPTAMFRSIDSPGGLGSVASGCYFPPLLLRLLLLLMLLLLEVRPGCRQGHRVCLLLLWEPGGAQQVVLICLRFLTGLIIRCLRRSCPLMFLFLPPLSPPLFPLPCPSPPPL